MLSGGDYAESVDVATEHDSISSGDLIVIDPEKLSGAVLGKALGAIESGRGVIEVLISLQ